MRVTIKYKTKYKISTATKNKCNNRHRLKTKLPSLYIPVFEVLETSLS